jgi:nitrite reductase (NO-forming)
MSRRRVLGRLGMLAGVPATLAFAAACGTSEADRRQAARSAVPAPQAKVPTASTMPNMDHAAATAPVTGKPMAIPFDPTLPPVGPEPVKTVLLTSTDDVVVPLSKEVSFTGWGFNGTIPGPAIRVRQGDTINATLDNKGAQGHSIDFHAAQTPWDVNFKTILPNQSLNFSWQANYPGCFMYHCGTPPVLHHISNGMYGAIVVDPKDGWPTVATREYALVQSEFYVNGNKPDPAKMDAAQPSFVAFNGVPNQYVDHPITAEPGERIRLYVVNAGPSIFSGFHIVGAIFEAVYPDGNPANKLTGVQTYTVPPGGGSVFDVVVPETGMYPIVTHAFAYASKGAVGMLKVGQPTTGATGGH